MVLVEADPRGKWEVGTHAYEHPAPVRVIQVEVKLVHPALLVLQMGAVVALVSDGHQDAGRFSRFQDRHHLVGFGILEVRFHEFVPPALGTVALRRFENRSTPFLGSVLQPVLKLIGDVRQGLPGHPLPFAVGIEETEHALWLLEWLDQTVQQETIETPIPELDVILVMLDEGVHGTLLWGEIPGAYRRERLLLYGHFQTRPDLSGSAGMAEGSRVRAGSICPHGGLSQARDLRAVSTNAPRGRIHPSPHRRGIPSARESR